MAGALAAAGFPARVTAHWVEAGPPVGGGGADGGLAGSGSVGVVGGGSQGGVGGGGGASAGAPRSSAPQKTTILIKFDPAVMAREARLAAAG